MTRVWQDVRFATRRLWRAPMFSVTVIATLALAIGATTAVFTVVNGVLLRALPYHEPARLALLSAYRGRLSGLTAAMAGHYLDAVDDLRPDGTDDLYRRFVGWARRALFAAAERRNRLRRSSGPPHGRRARADRGDGRTFMAVLQT